MSAAETCSCGTFKREPRDWPKVIMGFSHSPERCESVSMTRLRLAEEVCESVERYRDGGADEEWAIALLAVRRWRKARGK